MHNIVVSATNSYTIGAIQNVRSVRITKQNIQDLIEMIKVEYMTFISAEYVSNYKISIE